MSTSAAENITFMVVRGVIALAIVAVGFYCVAQGIHFFSLPRAEAEAIHIHFIALDITANGLGAVIFAVGLAICYLGKRTAPARIETMSTETPSYSTHFRTVRHATTVAQGPPPPIDVDPTA